MPVLTVGEGHGLACYFTPFFRTLCVSLRLLLSDLSPLLRPPHVVGSPWRVWKVTVALPSARGSRVVALSLLGAPSPTDGPPKEEPPHVDGPPEEEPSHDEDGEAREEEISGAKPASPRDRLRASLPYGLEKMHQIGLVCALTLSVIAGGFRMDWDPERGPAPPAFFANHPSAFEEAAFVAAAIADGVAARTMRMCWREVLVCILLLGVACNSVGKRRLIWDGRHVNAHLRKRKFRMESLQLEGRSLFERSMIGGTCDISQAYHHIEMAASATPYLGFEWAGVCSCFDVLPFGLSSAPWLFTTVMGHSVRVIRYKGGDVIAYLDDVIFGAKSAGDALTWTQRMLRILQSFGG